MDFEKDIDWSEIASRLPVAKDTRLTVGALPQIDFYFEKAFVNAANRSLSADLQSLVIMQLRQHRQVRCETINFLANQHGLTFEEAFVRLALDEPLNE